MRIPKLCVILLIEGEETQGCCQMSLRLPGTEAIIK